MHNFAVSTSGGPTVQAFDHGRKLMRELGQSAPEVPVSLTGATGGQLDLACLAVTLLSCNRAIVLQPEGVSPHESFGSGASQLPSATACSYSGRECWQVALYTSGSTGAARAYGFSLAQLDQLAASYATIYRVSASSVVLTCLPVSYNFTFIAGLYLAATYGLRLHFADSPAAVFADAARLAGTHDRCIILGNPVLLAEPPNFALPKSVLIDSGGAPLSTTSIRFYRERVADLREGYGLTETGSLTHFDSEGTAASLGTVGASMAQVHTTVVDHGTHPRIVLETPTLGIPLGRGAIRPPEKLVTSDVGSIDAAGRLRILGRSDDYQIGGYWPRDTLDIAGTVLGTRCALVRHPTPATIHIRLLRTPSRDLLAAVRSLLVERMNLSPAAVSIDVADRALLHSHKIARFSAVQTSA